MPSTCLQVLFFEHRRSCPTPPRRSLLLNTHEVKHANTRVYAEAMYNALLDTAQIPNHAARWPMRRARTRALCTLQRRRAWPVPSWRLRQRCPRYARNAACCHEACPQQRHSRWTLHMKSRPCTISITSIKKHSALKLHTNAEFGIKRSTTASLNVPPLSLSYVACPPLSDDVPLRVIAPHE